MFESMRQWFFSRVSEPLLALIRSRFKTDMIAAVAITEFGLSLMEALVLSMMVYWIWWWDIAFDVEMSAGGYWVICAVMILGVAGPSTITASDLMSISRGQKTTLSPFVIGLIKGGMAWRYVSHMLIFTIFLNTLFISLALATGTWLGVVAGFFTTSLLLLKCVGSAIWQNQNMRRLVASSTPSARF